MKRIQDDWLRGELEKKRDALQVLTRDCREDMHEPDEQGITAEVIGNHLDNAMGDEVKVDHRNSEFVVIIKKWTSGTYYAKGIFNLADLINLARRASL